MHEIDSFSVVAGNARRYDNDARQGRISTADPTPDLSGIASAFYGARMHAKRCRYRRVVDFGPRRSTISRARSVQDRILLPAWDAVRALPAKEKDE